MTPRKPITTATAIGMEEYDAGYASSGEGAFSRAVARPRPDGIVSFGHPAGRKRRPLLTLAEKIPHEVRLILKMRNRLKNEPDAERRAKLEKNLSIKAAFLDRLLKEKAAI